ncbi:carbohydrate kinase family protein [Staphylococcus rostri]|uniref:carbohydrate kinase family protein n=1 Tax=Staphylococcus rostri TaxID=522262 RepID=UPI00285253B5|nr:carbohydrate kinase [Staphylococcus rostri]
MTNAFYAIGEALIDFIPTERDQLLKDVNGFMPQVGGAPCNVAAAVQKLTGRSHLITQLGTDAFGDRIVETLKELDVDTQWIERTSSANTALAFVSLTASGERDFSFYRKPSADMLYEPGHIQRIPLASGDMIHFCSVALVDSPMKEAHEALLAKAHEVGATVVFDPNVRLPLWDDHEAYQQTIQAFIPHADIVKISDEELTFITRIEDEQRALQSLFQGRVKAVIYTQGSAGASLIFEDGTTFTARPNPVEAVDTTGAGDAFIGALIAELMTSEQPIETLKTDGQAILTFANQVAGHVVQQYGALSSLPTREDL